MSDRSILVVDDDLMIRTLLARRLTRDGFDVDLAESGDRGLELAREKSYALILLDLIMPNTSGFDFLDTARGNLRGSPSIIVLSAEGDSATVDRCKGLGAVDFVRKPIKAATFSRAVERALDARNVESAVG